MLPLFAVTAATAFGLGWVVRPDSANSSNAGENGAANGSQTSSRSALSGSSQRGGSANEGPESQFLARYLVNGEISPEDMKAAMKEMSETNDPILRQKMFAALLENLTAENAKDAFLALQENSRGGGPGGRGGRGGNDELRLLANAWGRLDGAGAVAALKEIKAASAEEGGDRGRGGRGGGPDEIASALAGWATTDSGGAIAYMGELEEGREKQMAGFGILQGLLVNGVGEAMGFIQSLPKTEDGDRSKGFYMAMVTGEMLEQGLDAAKTWVDTVTDPDLRTGALARVAMEMMQDDREGAAAWLAQYGSEDSSAPAVSRLAESWSREDPQAVLNWAEDLSGKSKTEAYQQAMESWAREDPAAAGEYLGTLAASAERDAAVEGYATRVSREDPVAAMEWVQTIGDESLRQEAMVDVAQDWYRKDQAATNEWLASSGLSEEAVKSITEPAREERRGPGGRGGR
ncbi:hypothetical protein V2O64_13670 [Verrucomicrobiaceae bacterium 227]